MCAIGELPKRVNAKSSRSSAFTVHIFVGTMLGPGRSQRSLHQRYFCEGTIEYGQYCDPTS